MASCQAGRNETARLRFATARVTACMVTKDCFFCVAEMFLRLVSEFEIGQNDSLTANRVAGILEPLLGLIWSPP
jgi:hypothetical protein